MIILGDAHFLHCHSYFGSSSLLANDSADVWDGAKASFQFFKQSQPQQSFNHIAVFVLALPSFPKDVLRGRREHA